MKLNGWRTEALEDLAVVERGKFSARPRNDPKYYGGDIPFIQTGDVASCGGRITSFSQTLNAEGLKVSKQFPKGTIVVTIAANIGEVGEATFPLAFPDSLVGVVPNDGLDTTWLRYALMSKQPEMLRSATQAAQANINLQVLRPLAIEVPPPDEMRLIGNCFRVVESHLSALEKASCWATARRKALMQQLLTGKRRFPGFHKAWRKAELADICTEESIRNNGRLGNEAVRAVNKSQGMIPMKDHVVSDDLTRYKVIKPGWYAYNPMRINIGSICQWDGTEDALVSPDYVVFRCLPDQLDQSFFNAFRRSFRWDSFMARAGSGGVRVRIYFDDLGSLTLPIPCLDEQRRIGALFDTIDREIMLLERLLAAYQRQKRGLMQQLLTGKRRVRVPAATGNQR